MEKESVGFNTEVAECTEKKRRAKEERTGRETEMRGERHDSR